MKTFKDLIFTDNSVGRNKEATILFNNGIELLVILNNLDLIQTGKKTYSWYISDSIIDKELPEHLRFKQLSASLITELMVLIQNW